MTHINWEKYICPIRYYDQVWCVTRITIATFDSRQTWSVFFNILEFLRHSMYFEIVISYMGVKIMSKYFENYLHFDSFWKLNRLSKCVPFNMIRSKCPAIRSRFTFRIYQIHVFVWSNIGVTRFPLFFQTYWIHGFFVLFLSVEGNNNKGSTLQICKCNFSIIVTILVWIHQWHLLPQIVLLHNWRLIILPFQISIILGGEKWLQSSWSHWS